MFLAIALPLVFLPATRDTFLIKHTILQTVIPFLLIASVIKNVQLLKARLLIPILIFTAVLLLSMVNTSNTAVSVNALVDKLVFMGVYLIIASRNNEKFRSKFINYSLVAGFFVCLYGMIQSTGLDFIVWARTFGGRLSSSLGNPNFFSGYLVALIPLSLASAIKTSKSLKKLLLSVNTVFLIVCLVLTKTRGSWIAFIISMLVFLALAGKILAKSANIKRLYIISAAVMVFISSYIVLSDNDYTRKFKSIFNPNIASISERVFKWRTAQEMIKDHPLIGVGIGAVKVNYALSQAEARKKMRIVLRGTSESQVHNEYLQICAEAGALGLAAFLGIIVVFFAGVFRRRAPDSQPWITAGITAAVTGILVDSIPNFPLHIVPTGFLFWSYLGLMETPGTEDHKQAKQKIASTGNTVQVVYKTAIILVIILLWLKTVPNEFIADLRRSNGDMASKTKNWKKAAAEYEKAHRLSPVNGRICYDLGMAYVRLNDYDSAIRSFKESIRIRNYGEVYNDLANCYYLKDMKREAVKNWETAVYLGLPDPDDQDKVIKNLNILKSRMKEQ